MYMFDDAIGHIVEDGIPLAVAADGESGWIGFIAGSENGSAAGQDIGYVVGRELMHLVTDQAEVAVSYAEDFESVLVYGCFGNCSNDGVEARAITSAGQYSDALYVTRTHTI